MAMEGSSLLSTIPIPIQQPPGGIEVLWKEVSEECKALFRVTDIPDTAKMRGYFTVCELIQLKRKLLGRLNPELIYLEHEEEEIEERGESHLYSENQHVVQQQQQQLQHNFEGQQKQESSVIVQPFVVLPPPNCKTELGRDCREAAEEFGASSGAGAGAGVCAGACSLSSVIVQPFGQPPSGGDGGGALFGRDCREQPPFGTSAPARSINLVLKLLQIGGYMFRSFSEITPNRCRVLFNTRHILYECNLPVVQAVHDSFQPLRKLLTIDIHFDQISAIQFDCDKLFLRVEGPPSLTVTYNPLTPDDQNTVPNISEQDRNLLEQIEKGHLRLSPFHHLYFLNERLVKTLQCHFRDLPNFRRVMWPDYNECRY